MITLDQFPGLPPPDQITLCEINGVVRTSLSKETANISIFTESINRHPVINVTRDISCARDEGVSMYLEVEDPLLKRLTSVWYKQGFMEVLRLMTDPQHRINKLLLYPALYVLKIANTMTKIRHVFQPHLKDIGPKLTALYSHTRDWATSPVRYLAWHPHTTKIAVVTADDNVRIYCNELQVNPVLKCSSQKSVSMVAWRPFSVSEIAVGCEIGVIVWTVDPNSIFAKPSVSNANVLKSSSHNPITSVCWSPDGSLLLAGSPAGCEVQVWGPSGASCCLRRLAGGGTALLEFAPDGSRLFSATTSVIFRVWETTRWRAEKWTVKNGRVQTACWSPDSEILLFATEDEPLIYALKFVNATLFADDRNAPAVATPIIDVSKTELDFSNNVGLAPLVGGRVLDLKWSPRGHHIAATFKDSGVVAIFNIGTRPTIRVTPCCLVAGIGTEVCNAMSFQQNFTDGACLTIAWSTGRVQHFPIIYSSDDSLCRSSFFN